MKELTVQGDSYALPINPVLRYAMWALHTFFCACACEWVSRSSRVKTENVCWSLHANVSSFVGLVVEGGVADRCPFFLAMQFITPLVVETFARVQKPRKMCSPSSFSEQLKLLSNNFKPTSQKYNNITHNAFLFLFFFFPFSPSPHVSYYPHSDTGSKYILTRKTLKACWAAMEILKLLFFLA